MWAKRIVLLLPLLVLAAAPFEALAQLNEQINQQFRCLALDAPIREPLYTQPSGGEPLRIYTSSRTKPVFYSGPNPVVFYHETTDEMGQAVRVSVGQFEFTGNLKSPLLLFTKPDKGQAFRITAMEDSLAKTPVGSYRIFNFTQKDIAGMIGDARFRTRAGGEALTQLDEAGRVPVTVRLAEVAEGGPQRLYSATWNFVPSFRYLVFIIPTSDHTRGNISIRIVSDYIRPGTAMN